MRGLLEPLISRGGGGLPGEVPGHLRVPLARFWGGWVRLTGFRGQLAVAAADDVAKLVRCPVWRTTFLIQGRRVRSANPECRWAQCWPMHVDEHRDMHLNFDAGVAAVWHAYSNAPSGCAPLRQ